MTTWVASRARGTQIRGPVASALRWALLWFVLLIVALFSMPLLTASVSYAFAPAAAVVLVLLCTRFPAVAATGLALLAGFYVTFFVHVPSPVSPSSIAQGLIVGLLFAAGLMRARGIGAGEFRPAVGALAILCLSAVSLLWVLAADLPFVAVTAWLSTWGYALVVPALAFGPWDGLSRRLMQVMLVAGVLGGLYAALRWAIGPSGAEFEYAQNIGGEYTFFGTEVRPLGGVGDVHSLSGYAAPIVPFALALTLGLRDRWRVVSALALGVAAFTLLIAEVRIGYVAAVAGVATVIAMLLVSRAIGPQRILAAGLAMLVCGGVAGAVVAANADGTDLQSQRIRNILTPEQDESFQERMYVWGNALREIDEKPLGHGMGSAGSAGRASSRFGSDDSTDVVSSYLRVAYEQGIFAALVLVLALLASILAMVRTAITSTRAQTAVLATACAGATVTFAVQLAFESAYWEATSVLVGWMLLGLGLRQVAVRRDIPAAAAP